jgi:hypothetical protein
LLKSDTVSIELVSGNIGTGLAMVAAVKGNVSNSTKGLVYFLILSIIRIESFLSILT